LLGRQEGIQNRLNGVPGVAARIFDVEVEWWVELATGFDGNSSGSASDYPHAAEIGRQLHDWILEMKIPHVCNRELEVNI